MDVRVKILCTAEDRNYELGTTEGELQQCYSRDRLFTICKDKFASVDEVPDVQLSPRGVARLFSKYLGCQGYRIAASW